MNTWLPRASGPEVANATVPAVLLTWRGEGSHGRYGRRVSSVHREAGVQDRSGPDCFRGVGEVLSNPPVNPSSGPSGIGGSYALHLYSTPNQVCLRFVSLSTGVCMKYGLSLKCRSISLTRTPSTLTSRYELETRRYPLESSPSVVCVHL